MLYQNANTGFQSEALVAAHPSTSAFTLGLPPEIMDALQHLGGRNNVEINRIICNALRNEFHRRAQKAQHRKRLTPVQSTELGLS